MGDQKASHENRKDVEQQSKFDCALASQKLEPYPASYSHPKPYSFDGTRNILRIKNRLEHLYAVPPDFLCYLARMNDLVGTRISVRITSQD